MGRLLAILCVLALTVGCHGQGGNPFMRTTVPPPATGAGAPSDPYYNNSGAAQPPAVAAPQAVPPPGAVPPTPVVPPPDTRYSPPGGYNFPQGSVNHRKAVDPTPNDYRAGTSAIARAARPRNLLGSSHGDTAIATTKIAPKSQSHTDPSHIKLVQSSQTEEPIPEVAGVENASRTPPSHETAATEVDSQPSVATMALEPTDESVSERGSASVRIVASDPNDDKSTSQPAEVSMSATESTAPLKATVSSSMLTVAPPVAGAKDGAVETQLAVTAGASKAKNSPPNSTRFYFDRAHPVTRHDAQQAAYVAKDGDSVVFASGVNGTRLSSGPDGAPAYSHHDGYAWARGKLEYSSASRRWKLRYIPIDGQTDQFGGSIVLPSSPQLEQFHPGDMVTVEGTIGTSPAERGSFSPLYEVRTIKSQR